MNLSLVSLLCRCAECSNARVCDAASVMRSGVDTMDVTHGATLSLSPGWHARAGIADCAGTMGDLGVAFDRMAELLVAEHARRAGIEASLRRSVAHQEDVLASLHEVVFQTDVEGRWLLLSPAWVEITGFSV